MRILAATLLVVAGLFAAAPAMASVPLLYRPAGADPVPSQAEGCTYDDSAAVSSAACDRPGQSASDAPSLPARPLASL